MTSVTAISIARVSVTPCNIMLCVTPCDIVLCVTPCIIMLCWLLQDRVRDLNAQAERFVREQHFDSESIQEKQRSIHDRYARLAEGKSSHLFVSAASISLPSPTA